MDGWSGVYKVEVRRDLIGPFRHTWAKRHVAFGVVEYPFHLYHSALRDVQTAA